MALLDITMAGFAFSIIMCAFGYLSQGKILFNVGLVGALICGIITWVIFACDVIDGVGLVG